jgi:hypothetical protein
MARLLGAAILIACFLNAGSAVAGTYYISKSIGSDSNTPTQAHTKSTPWAHLPGMASCTSNCASYTPAAGDTFILMGCDRWVAPDLPVAWDWSGTTVTVDKTWFNTTNCPSGWNRPVFDAQANSSVTWFIKMGANNSVSNDTFDNIEMKGFNSAGSRMTGCFNQCINPTMTNNYIHAWALSTDNCVVFQTGGQPNIGGTFSNNVLDGSDRIGTSGSFGVCYGIYHDWPSVIKNNVFRDLVNSLVGGVNSGGVAEISGNLIDTCISSQGAANHANCLESFFGGTVYIHDNIINQDNANNEGEVAFLGSGGETDYVWNNIFYNITGNAPETEFRNGTLSQFWYNNTFVNIVGGTCLGATGSNTSSTVVVKNNHCIGGALPTNGGAYTVSNNLTQTSTQANANSSPHFDQYTVSQFPVFDPVASTNSTVGAGQNLTSQATGNLAGLTNATNYACTQQTVSGVVQAVCPGRTSVARPASGSWDVGAYQFSSSTVQAPQPPRSLQATVQ